MATSNTLNAKSNSASALTALVFELCRTATTQTAAHRCGASNSVQAVARTATDLDVHRWTGVADVFYGAGIHTIGHTP
jgi:hypothetical protein